MNEIIELARALGGKIQSHERHQNLQATEKKLQANPELKKLMDDYHNTFLAIQQKERAQQPVEPAEKRNLAELQQKVIAEPLLQEAAKVQTEYTDMMNQVNAAIAEGLGATLTHE